MYCCQAPGKTVSIAHRSFICIRNGPIVVVRLRYPARCSRSLPTASSRPGRDASRQCERGARAERTSGEALYYFPFRPPVRVGSSWASMAAFIFASDSVARAICAANDAGGAFRPLAAI